MSYIRCIIGINRHQTPTSTKIKGRNTKIRSFNGVVHNKNFPTLLLRDPIEYSYTTFRFKFNI